MTYLDAAYIAKFYIAESDSGRVREFLASAYPVVSCIHGMAEVVSVFHRKFREGTVPQADFEHFCAQFDSDCRTGLWTWLPMTGDLVDSSRRRIGRLPNTVFLRASDALHLTCAVENGLTAVHTNDRHMVAAAPAFGLRAVTL